MEDSQKTRFSLLVRLRDRDDGRAWAEFVEIYSPVVYGFVRRKGLQDADAADVTQNVFRTVARSIDGFDCDRRRGSFRGWLMTVARSRLSDFLSARARHVPGSGQTDVFERLAEEPAPEEEGIWEKEYRKSLFDWAARQVRDAFQDHTWQAFWQTGMEGKDAREVAQSLDMTEGAVYAAKCRVLARLKKTIEEIEQ